MGCGKPVHREDIQQYPQNGCCADGGSCDDLCVEVAATYLCQQACGAPAGIEITANQLPQIEIHSPPKTGSELPEQCCAHKDDQHREVPKIDTIRGSKAHCTNINDIGCCGEVTDIDRLNYIVSTNVDEKSLCQSKCCDEVEIQSKQQLCCSVAEKSVEDSVDSTLKAIESDCRSDCCSSPVSTTTLDTVNSVEKSRELHFDSCCSPAAACGKSTDHEHEIMACSKHLDAAMKKFTALLEAGLCICRDVLANADVCCDQKRRSAAMRSRAHRTTAMKKCTKKNAKSRCSSTASNSCLIKDSGCEHGSSDCCSSIKSSKVHSQDVSDSQMHFNEDLNMVATCGTKNCCSDKGNSGPTAVDSEKVSHSTNLDMKQIKVCEIDIEKAADVEHLSFSVVGMDCTGCGNQVTRVLDRIEGVFDGQINFVAARGDCKINTATVSVAEVLRRLENETGFKIARIIASSLKLDVMMSSDSADSLIHDPYDGISEVESLGKQSYRITFDPNIIGARALLLKTDGQLAPPSKDNVVLIGKKIMIRKMCLFLLATVLTIPILVLAWGNIPDTYMSKSIVSLILATAIQGIAVPEFYIPAIKSLIFSKSIEMDMLVVISVTAAYGYSLVAFGLTHAGYTLSEGPYFETSALLITLIILGRLVASYAKVQAINSVSTKSLQVDTAYLQTDEHLTQLDARLLEYHDIIHVRPHSRVVTDGIVISGSSSIDEAMLTGETVPVHKEAGSHVVAGTMNGTGLLSVRVTRLPGQNSISDIANLVTDALESKPKVQDLADKVASWFVFVVVGISILVFAIWLRVSLKNRSEDAGSAVGHSITYGIAVLAISCPCALGLAVPLVLVIAGGVAAKDGVVIKQASVSERAFRATDIVFDKTGTLTTGKLEVAYEQIGTDRVNQALALQITLGLVKDNSHPVSSTVASHFDGRVSAIELQNVHSVSGAGIIGKYGSSIVKAGSPAWVEATSKDSVVACQTQGLTILCVTMDDEPIATFGLQATVRPEAAILVRSLRAQGIKVHVVSGDNAAAVKTLATNLNISAWVAEKSPAGKRVYIQQLQSRGKKVIFVGDGTNDAAAIAQADVGLQIGDTSDISRAAADVVLLGGLNGVTSLLDISRRAYRRIMFNFVWSAVYNVVAIVLASGAAVKFRIPPAYAGLGEVVSVLPVVAVALSLSWA